MPVVHGVETPLEPPAGYVVDFDNPQRKAMPDSYYIAGFGMTFGLLLMWQRMYTKMYLGRGLEADDDMFVAGAGGTHGWEMTMHQYEGFTLDMFLSSVLFLLCGSLAKTSLLIFYLRLTPHKWFRFTVWSIIAVVSAYTIGITLALIFMCNPIPKAWDIYITEGHCLNRADLYFATAVSNIASDVVLFLLPLPILVRLQVPMQQKIGLFVIFTIGSMTVVTSIVRLHLVPGMRSTDDVAWDVGYISMWILIEANLRIMCAAVPTLRAFLRHMAPRIIGEGTYGKAASKKNDVPGPSRACSSRYGFVSKRDPVEPGGECIDMTAPKPGGVEGNSAEGTNSRVRGSWNDDDSERAIVVEPEEILQTAGFTGEYSTDGGKGGNQRASTLHPS
ncbi:related to integral membrane protein [Cephalotrichum gorgonifer]|uniref:Related to integral membrane protein n=1 Tax=Cephalotrichum gorgonifer TaxID=2041049 RepID=A0AAE8N6G9_9PEZI|nr:related to integral membrane protein [Cephalotrichum gorgonifer]